MKSTYIWKKNGITELCLRTRGQSSSEISSNECSSKIVKYLRITTSDKAHATKRMQKKPTQSLDFDFVNPKPHAFNKNMQYGNKQENFAIPDYVKNFDDKVYNVGSLFVLCSLGRALLSMTL